MIAGALEVQLFANLARIQQDINKATGIVTAGAKAMETAAAGVKSALGAIAAGFSVHLILEKISSVTEGLAKLKDASEKTGASVENMSKLQFFSSVGGSSVEGVTAALAKLSKGMAGVGNESAPTTQALKFLGLSAKDAAGNLKDPSVLFGEISQKLIVYRDGAGKAAIAQALFGKAGAEMLPTLKKMAELGEIEASVTTAQAQAAEDYQVKLALLHRQKEILWNAVVSALLPSMQSFVQMLLDASKQTDSLGGAVKGLAADHSIESWADTGAMGIAILIDAFKAIPQVAAVAIAEVIAAVGALDVLLKASILANPATATARIVAGGNPLQELKDSWKAMNLAQADADAKMQGFLTSEVDGTQRAMAKIIALRKAAAQDVARDMEGSSRPGADEGKALNFALGDPKKAAAELLKYENALKSLEDQLGKLNEMTVEQKMVNDLARGSLKGLTDEHQRNLIAVAKLVDQENIRKVAREAYVKTMEVDLALEQEIADLIASRATKEGEAIKAQHKVIEDLQFETSLIGKSNAERETAIALRALEASSSAKVSGGIDRESAEYERLTVKLREGIQAKIAAEALNPKILEQMQFEIKLIGLTNTEREQAIALRALELTGVDQTTEAYKRYVEALKNNIAQKNFAEESKQQMVGMWQDIDRVAHDTFTSIFDSGKSAFDRLRDTLKNGLYSLLYQLTIRPILINIATSIGGAGVAQAAFPGGATGGGGIGNLLSTGNSLYNTLSGNSSSLLNSITSSLGMGGALSGGSVAALGANTLSIGGTLGASGQIFGTIAAESFVGAAAPLFGTAVEGSAAIFGTLAAEGAGVAAGGLMTGLSVAMPYIGLAIAAASMLGLFGGSKKAPAVGTGYSFLGSFDPTAGANINEVRTHYKAGERVGYDLGNPASHHTVFQDAIQPAFDEFKKLAEEIGLITTGIGRTSFQIDNIPMGSGHQDVVAASAAAADLLNKWAEELLPNIKDIALEGEEVIQTFVRLSAESKLVDQILDLIGQTMTATGASGIELKDELVQLMGGLQNASAITESYYANFFTDSERFAIDLRRVNTAMTELGVSAIPRTRAEFRLLVEAQDLNTRAGKEMFAALLQLAPAFAAVTVTMEEAAAAANTLASRIAATQAAALESVRDQITASRAASSAASQAADSFRQIAATLADAIGRIRGTGVGSAGRLQSVFGTAITGDAAALSALPQAATDFLTASLATSRTATEFARDQARTIGMLEQAGLVALGQASVQDRQAALMSAQVVILEVIQAELEKPSPDLAVLNEQRALLGLIGAYSLEQLGAIVEGAAKQADGIAVIADLLRELVDLTALQAAADDAVATARAIADARAAAEAAASARAVSEAAAAAAAAAAIANAQSRAAPAAAGTVTPYLDEPGYGPGYYDWPAGNGDNDTPVWVSTDPRSRFFPGHAGGLPYVPYDNYLFRAHQGEAVLTAPQATQWRASGADNAELIEEIKALRAEVKAGNEKIAQYTRKTADTTEAVANGQLSFSTTAA